MDSVVIDEEEFVKNFLHEMSEDDIEIADGDLLLDGEVFQDIPMSHDAVSKRPVSNKVSDEEKPVKKVKRRANLTEFGDSLTTKRKNETAKRELTSVVNQLGKIDKQLNTIENKPRVAINFVATFTSFKSNRVSTYKYPLDAEIKKTFLEYDATMAAIKNAVKDAMSEVHRSEPKTTDSATSNATTAIESSLTPTKIITAFSSLPSPVTGKRQPSKNLCTKNSCTFGKKLRKHVWVKCSHRSGKEDACAYWVHASCIGFPYLKEENVKMLDGWCCPEHTEEYLKRK